MSSQPPQGLNCRVYRANCPSTQSRPGSVGAQPVDVRYAVDRPGQIGRHRADEEDSQRQVRTTLLYASSASRTVPSIFNWPASK